MNKKILLTGMPRSGKTTLLSRLISTNSNKTGFLTREMRENNERVGFEVVTSLRGTAVLADVRTPTAIKVARYYVNIESLEKVLPSLENYGPNDILYIDEIGQMELFSDSFKRLVNKYLDSDNFFLGTISKIHRDAFIGGILNRKDIELIEITPENRELAYLRLASWVRMATK